MTQSQRVALKMIHEALGPIIAAGRSIDRIKLMVCPSSQMAEYRFIDLDYGRLWVVANQNLPKGYSYLIEDPGKKGRGFAWVSQRKVTQ
jgi:hypothetical protein